MDDTQIAEQVLAFLERDGVVLSADLAQVEAAVLTQVQRIVAGGPGEGDARKSLHSNAGGLFGKDTPADLRDRCCAPKCLDLRH